MAFSLLEAMSETCFRKPEVNIVLIGVDGAGKTSILERMKTLFQSAGRKKPPSIPIDKVQATIGLNIAKFDIAACRVVVWDLGGAQSMLTARGVLCCSWRAIWRSYFADCHGCAFVVDASDAARLREARDEFQAAARELRALPCLVLANKQDARGAASAGDVERLFLDFYGAVPVSAAAGSSSPSSSRGGATQQGTTLITAGGAASTPPSRSAPILVQATSARTTDGIVDGILWLVDQARSRSLSGAAADHHDAPSAAGASASSSSEPGGSPAP